MVQIGVTRRRFHGNHSSHGYRKHFEQACRMVERTMANVWQKQQLMGTLVPTPGKHNMKQGLSL
jgi:hypothetical protein